MFFFISCNALSLEGENTDLVGTHAVIFTPIQSEGKLTACTLNFTSIFEDRKKLKGNQLSPVEFEKRHLLSLESV